MQPIPGVATRPAGMADRSGGGGDWIRPLGSPRQPAVMGGVVQKSFVCRTEEPLLGRLDQAGLDRILSDIVNHRFQLGLSPNPEIERARMPLQLASVVEECERLGGRLALEV